MSLKMFEFTIRNCRTHEEAAFLGQGETVQEAWKDGTSNAASKFRPKSDGVERGNVQGCAVTLPDGRIVSRTLVKFEGDEPFNEEKEKRP